MTDTPSSPVKLHEILQQHNVKLHPALLKAIEGADITVPPMRHTAQLLAELWDFVNQSGDHIKASSPINLMAVGSQAKRTIYSRLSEQEFPGLSAVEKILAMRKLGAVGGDVVTQEIHPNLMILLQAACNEVRANTVPRMLVVKSDLPVACYAKGPCGDGAIFVSTDLVERLAPSEMKAIIGHEIEEGEYAKAHPIQLRAANLKHKLGYPHDSDMREFRADDRGAKTEGGKPAMVSALKKVNARREELEEFQEKLKHAVKAGIRNFIAEDKVQSQAEGQSPMIPGWLGRVVDRHMSPAPKPPATHPALKRRLNRLEDPPDTTPAR